MDILPTNSKHPFWSASTGSQLKLVLKKPPECQIKEMIIVVYTISEPYIYSIKVILSDGTIGSHVYHKKKEAIKIIDEVWYKYYQDRTNIEFVEHKTIDIPNIDLSLASDSENNVYDSCPPTPSPRAVRKSSLKSMLKEIAETHRKSGDSLSSSSSSSSNSNSSEESSPRSKESSPRTTNTKKNWISKRLSRSSSRSNSPRNGSPRNGNSGNGNSGNGSPRSDDNSPRCNESPRTPSTPQLLRRASLKLALRNSKIKDESSKSPMTPRNSESGIDVN